MRTDANRMSHVRIYPLSGEEDKRKTAYFHLLISILQNYSIKYLNYKKNGEEKQNLQINIQFFFFFSIKF